MRRKESEIAFLDDIVRKTAKRTGFSEEVIREYYKLFLKRLHIVANDNHTMVIRIGALGRFYLTVRELRRMITESEGVRKANYENKMRLYDLYKDLRWAMGNPYYTFHNFVKRLHQKKYSGGKSITEIEENQNIVADEAKG